MDRMKNFILHCRRRIETQKLVKKGVIKPVCSYEEYSVIVKTAKKASEFPLFTNCFMMADEINRLIGRRAFYHLKTESGAVFLEDEETYYYAFFYIDPGKSFQIPQLDKSIMTENVYRHDQMSQPQKDFEERLQKMSFVCNALYFQMHSKPQLSPEKYYKQLNAVNRQLELRNMRVAPPINRQLREFEKIYRLAMDPYIQKGYTRKERKRQRDKGFLRCLTDDSMKIYAIQISTEIHGGAIATNPKYDSEGYGVLLFVKSYEAYYRAMPEDEVARKEYMRCKAFGWIKSTNTASLRLHKLLGYTMTGKEMHQFIKPGYCNY